MPKLPRWASPQITTGASVVGSPACRGAAEEAERILQHPLDPQGDEEGNPACVLTVEDGERVSIGAGTVLRVRAAAQCLPSESAGVVAILVGGDVRVLEAQPSRNSSHGAKVASRRGVRTT
jgi:hypothetical protein